MDTGSVNLQHEATQTQDSPPIQDTHEENHTSEDIEKGDTKSDMVDDASIFSASEDDPIDVEMKDAPAVVMSDSDLEDPLPGSLVESDGHKMVVLGPNESSYDRTAASPSTSLDSCTFAELSEQLHTLKPKRSSKSRSKGMSDIDFMEYYLSGEPLEKMIPCSHGIPEREWGPGDRVTIWNIKEKRKVAGNAAPLFRNLVDYFATHPYCEVYNNQDYDKKKRPPRRRKKKGMTEAVEDNKHVAMWDVKGKRKLVGNAAPLEKNVSAFLERRPDFEIYDGQDMRGDHAKCASSRITKKRSNCKKGYKRDMPRLCLASMSYLENWTPCLAVEDDFAVLIFDATDPIFSNIYLAHLGEEETLLDDIDEVTSEMVEGGFLFDSQKHLQQAISH